MAEAEQARAAEIASPARAAWPVGPVPGERRERSRSAGLAWAQRAVALIVLIVWAIVVYRVLHGIV